MKHVADCFSRLRLLENHIGTTFPKRFFAEAILKIPASLVAHRERGGQKAFATFTDYQIQRKAQGVFDAGLEPRLVRQAVEMESEFPGFRVGHVTSQSFAHHGKGHRLPGNL